MSDPVIATGPEEIFAWGFMIGYLGDIPDAMRDALKDTDGLSSMEDGNCPEFFTGPHARQWKRGYESGLSTFTYHNGDND
jgi:hypothetical protein